ncbi:MAG: c-type cytochrome [Saprospiraceae bacterium]
MFRPQLAILLFTMLVFACQPQKNEDTEVVEEETVEEAASNEAVPLLEVNLVHAKEEGALAATEVVIASFDPVFKRVKKYEAIPLKPYLEKLIITSNLDTANTEIIFLCKDGYNPSMALSKVLQNEPYLAIRDLEALADKNWMDTLQGKWNPFYLIWTNYSQGDKGYTWPYGLKYLQFKTSEAAYKAAFPLDEQKVAGFELYKEKCMKCHAMNMVGGVMGPEMNVPKNITEYWQIADIKAFVKNPYGYRYNSKMSPVVDLKETDLDKIMDYIIYMKGQKIEME